MASEFRYRFNELIQLLNLEASTKSLKHRATLKTLNSHAPNDSSSMFDKANFGNNNSYILNHQLEIGLMLDNAHVKLKELCFEQNLDFSKVSSTLYYNKRTLSFELKAQLPGLPENAALAGRAILVRLMTPQSQTNQDKFDIFTRLASLCAAAKELARQTDDDSTSQSSRLLGIHDDIERCDARISHQIELVFQPNGIGTQENTLLDKARIDKSRALLQSAHGQLITILRKYSPQLNNDALLKHEPLMLAQSKRAILVTITPNLVDDTQWLSNVHVPHSDVPSTLRNGKDDILPNWYTSSTQVYQISAGQAVSLENYSNGRSSSFPPIKEKDPVRRKDKAARIAKNFLLKTFTTNLNTLLKNKSTLSETDLEKVRALLTPSLSLVTLLSPVVKPSIEVNEPLIGALQGLEQGKGLWSRIGTFIRNGLLKLALYFATPGALNEYAQMQETQTALIGNKLKLGDLELEQIWRGIPKTMRSEPSLKQALLNQVMEPNLIFQNFGVNDARNLDTTGAEAAINQASLEGLLKSAKTLFQQPLSVSTPVDEKYKSDIEENIKELQYLSTKLGFEALKIKTPSYSLGALKILSDNVKTGYLLLHLKNLCQGGLADPENVYNPNLPENNYLRPLFSALVSKRLNYMTHVTCKSGEDRTGALDALLSGALFILSASSTRTVSNFTKLRDELWKQFSLNEPLSASRLVTDANAPGARGLQSLSGTGASRYIRLGLARAMRPLLPDKMLLESFQISNFVAKLAKAPFKSSAWDFLKKSKANTEQVPDENAMTADAILSSQNQALSLLGDPLANGLDDKAGAPKVLGELNLQKPESNKPLSDDFTPSPFSNRIHPLNIQTINHKTLQSIVRQVFNSSQRTAIGGVGYDDSRNCFTINQNSALQCHQDGGTTRFKVIPTPSRSDADTRLILLAHAIIATGDIHPEVESGNLNEIQRLNLLLQKLDTRFNLKLSSELTSKNPEWASKITVYKPMPPTVPRRQL